MHARLLVIVDKEEVKTSEEAQQLAFEVLCSENFVGEGSRFGSPVGDWMVNGGRWSGELTKARLDKNKLEAFEKEFGDKYGWWVGKDVSETDRQKQAEELFRKHFPDFKGKIPYWRDTYAKEIFEDDAQIVDEELWTKLLEECDRDDSPDYYNGNALIHIREWDGVEKERAMGNWVVVLDFHS